MNAPNDRTLVCLAGIREDRRFVYLARTNVQVSNRQSSMRITCGYMFRLHSDFFRIVTTHAFSVDSWPAVNAVFDKSFNIDCFEQCPRTCGFDDRQIMPCYNNGKAASVRKSGISVSSPSKRCSRCVRLGGLHVAGRLGRHCCWLWHNTVCN